MNELKRLKMEYKTIWLLKIDLNLSLKTRETIQSAHLTGTLLIMMMAQLQWKQGILVPVNPYNSFIIQMVLVEI